MEPLTEPGKPPACRLLDEVGIAPVRQHLDRRPGMDAEEAQPGHYAGEVIQHSVEAVGFDVAVEGVTTWIKCLLSGVVARKCRGTMNSPSTTASNNF